MIEFATQKLEQHPMIIEFIFSINMGENDEMGQTLAELDNLLDNVLKVACGINLHKVNKFWLGTYNPTQLQPTRGCPFLLSPCFIPCCKIVPIKYFVCSQYSDFLG